MSPSKLKTASTPLPCRAKIPPEYTANQAKQILNQQLTNRSQRDHPGSTYQTGPENNTDKNTKRNKLKQLLNKHHTKNLLDTISSHTA
jgi:hypothetical protein